MHSLTQLRSIAVVAAAGLLTAACHIKNESSSGGGTVAAQPSQTQESDPNDNQGTINEIEPNRPTQEQTSTTFAEVKKSSRYHHWNPRAWDGRGVALVTCPSTNGMDWCKFNGKSMAKHGNRDKGRDVWTFYNDYKGSGGTVQCKRGNEIWEFKVRGGSSIDFGNC